MTNTEIIANLATIIAKQNLEISELNTEVQHLHHELLARMNEADRKTEPQTEDEYITELIKKKCETEPQTEQTEPQPCEWCKFYDGENCSSQEPCKVMLYFKTEPQTDYKMPYKDCEDCETHLKAQYGYCNECKWHGDKQVCGRCRSRNLYAPKDEPQTERSE